MSRKPKQSVTVQLPSAFVDFMHDVNQRIEDGDEAATTIESDDLLQCDCGYGGLYDIDGQRYGFCYFHTDDATWDFDLDAHQIAQIANGTLTAINLWKCLSDKCDCLYATEDSYCTHCDSIGNFDDYQSRLRIHRPDESPDVLAIMANLRKIGLAIIEYHWEHGHFPPVHTHDETGRPMHSWRSFILPFLDEDSIFENIDFGQPWNSDTNRPVWEQRPAVFGGHGCETPLTNVMAVVGPDTIWPATGRRSHTDIMTGTSFTIAAVFLTGMSVNWMQPIDADLASAISDYENNHELIAVFVDGHVEVVRDVNTGRLRKLLCI